MPAKRTAKSVKPKKLPQNFVITLERMNTCDEAELVSRWSAVVEEKDLINFGALAVAAQATEIVLKHGKDALTNVRPMTEAEIAAYRKALPDDED